MYRYIICIIDMKVSCIILQHSIFYRCEILLSFLFCFSRFKKITNTSIPLQKAIFCLSKLKVWEIPEHCTRVYCTRHVSFLSLIYSPKPPKAVLPPLFLKATLIA